MFASAFTSGSKHRRGEIILLLAALSAAVPLAAARAEGCAFALQGEGRVAEIVDGRSFRLTDGREIRLAGIEPVRSATAAIDGTAVLTSILAGQDVTLRGADDAPDRYGRQAAFVFLASSDALVQGLLLAQGAALVSADIAEKGCEGILMQTEADARKVKKGLWNASGVIKNAEIPDDILAGIGQFTVVEGKVLSVRQAGTTTYLNFGRNWGRGFAVTISRRTMPAVESAGLALKSLENRRIRVRGWVESRGGPRIELLRADQLEVLDVN